MRRGERAQAEQLLAELAKEAQAALADNNEHQRVPIEPLNEGWANGNA